jgi:mannose-1-phosphate guanylyltransferase
VKALILAGGLGTRLRPLTYTRPKHLLPIANRPHIEHVFVLLGAHGIGEVVLLTSYMAEAFEGADEHGLHVEVAHEEEPLGTAGALKNAEPLVGDDTFFAFNGDVLTDADLGEILDFHQGAGALATIVLTPVDDPSAYGVVPTDDSGRVLGFIEKPPRGEEPTNLINAGIYVFEPEILERIPAGKVHSAERELFPGLVEEKAPLYARGTDAYWMDIGTPEKYLQANLDALGGGFKTDAVPSPGPGTALIAHDAVAAGATVTDSCLGSGSVVEAEATVERSVLLPGARVGAGATVAGSILGAGAEVLPGTRLNAATVADGEKAG